MSYASWKTIKLKSKLNPTDTSLIADVDVWVTNWRLYFNNDSQEEWINFTWVSSSGSNYSYTWLTRWLSQTADPATAWTWLTWLAGSEWVLVAMHDQLVDRRANNTFSWENTFEERIITEKWVEASTYATTSARDTALWWDWVAVYSYTNIYVTATWLFYNYNLSSNQWEEVDTWTATPNASTTVAWKVELATDAEITSWAWTWWTWAVLSPTPTQIKKSISLKNSETSSEETDEFVFNDAGEDKRITKANLREDLAWSKTLKGTFEMLTDAEAETWTDEERVPNIKQINDIYSLSIVAWEVYTAVNNTSSKDTTSWTYTKVREFTINRWWEFRITFSLEASAWTAYWRIYKNWVAFWTERSTWAWPTDYTEDLEFDKDDLIQLYLKTDPAWTSTSTNASMSIKYNLQFSNFTVTTNL